MKGISKIMIAVILGTALVAAGGLAAAASPNGTGDSPAMGIHRTQGQAQVDNITIFYETFGPADRETVLLIAGAGAQMTMWSDELCEELAGRGYHVVRFDNRDTGLSTRLDHLGRPDWEEFFTAVSEGRTPPVPYTITDMANDAVGLLDALDIKRAHIAGASMGGAIAQRIAIHHPERACSLTLFSSETGNPEMPGPTEELLTLPPPPPAGSDIETIVEHEVLVAGVLGSPAYPTDEEVIREYTQSNIERGGYDPIALERHSAAVMADGDRRELLKRLNLTTVVLHGDADPLVPVENGYDLAANIPGAELTVVPGMGHDIPVQLEPAFADAITRAATNATCESNPDQDGTIRWTLPVFPAGPRLFEVRT